MSENIKQIAQRIKAVREIAGVSADALADEFGIPRDTFRRYETGDVDIPVSLLYEIAGRFKVELTALLTGEEPRLHHYSLVRAGQGVEVERRAAYKYRDLAYNFVHKKIEVFEVTVEPRPADIPPSFNRHPGQEYNYILAGTLKVLFEGHEVVLRVGDSLYFDSGQKHAMLAENNAPAKFLAIIL